MANKRASTQESKKAVCSQQSARQNPTPGGNEPLPSQPDVYHPSEDKRLKLAEWPECVKREQQEQELFDPFPDELRVGFEDVRSSIFPIAKNASSNSQSKSSIHVDAADSTYNVDMDLDLDEPPVQADATNHSIVMGLEDTGNKTTTEYQPPQDPSSSSSAHGEVPSIQKQSCSRSNKDLAHATLEDMVTIGEEPATESQQHRIMPPQTFCGKGSCSKNGRGSHDDPTVVAPTDTKEADEQMLAEAAQSPQPMPDTEEGEHGRLCQAATFKDADKMQSFSKPWTVDDTPEEDVTYTLGESKFVQILNEDKPVLLIEFNEDFMWTMKSATAARRRWAKLAEMIQKKKDDLFKEKARCLEAYKDISARLEVMKNYLPTNRQDKLEQREREAAEHRTRLQEEQAAMENIDSQLAHEEELFNKACQDCWLPMWSLSVKHERMLRDAGVSPIQDESCSSSDQYSPHAPPHSKTMMGEEVATAVQQPQNMPPHHVDPDVTGGLHDDVPDHDTIAIASEDERNRTGPILLQAARSIESITTSKESDCRITFQSAAVKDDDNGKPLLEPWMADNAHEKNLVYCRNESRFVRMVNDDRPVALIEFSKDYMEGLKRAATAGRRLEKLKETTEKEEQDMEIERERCSRTCAEMSYSIRRIMGYSPARTAQRRAFREKQIAEFRERLQEAEVTIEEIAARIQRGRQLRAEAVDESWSTMWAMNLKNERMFSEARVSLETKEHRAFSRQGCATSHDVASDTQSHSANQGENRSQKDSVEMARDFDQHGPESFKLNARHRSRDTVDSDTESYDEVRPPLRTKDLLPPSTITWTPPATISDKEGEVPPQQHCPDSIESDRERIADYKYAFNLARDRHDKHRENYNQIFARYEAGHPDLQGHELAEKFSAAYLEKWQRLIKTLKDTEDTLVKAQKEEKADKLLQGREENERDLEEYIQQMNANIIKSFNRDKIQRWLAKVPDDIDSSETIEESPALRPGEGSHPSTKANEHEQGPSGRQLDIQQDTAEHEPGGPALPPERQLQPHENDTADDDRQQPHVDDVFMDSTSVFNVDPATRREIDGLAREFRDGYY